MRITGYKILIILGMLILHSLPFVVYKYSVNNTDLFFGMFLVILTNIGIIGLSGIYNKIFKKIHKLMKKEIKLW